MFKTEQEAIEWVWLHTPIAIKPTKKSKKLLVPPFTSGHAFDVVVEHLGKELFKI